MITMESCCALGEEGRREERILHRTSNFFVTPALGQIGIEGYLLICANEHFRGIGDMPATLDSELEALVDKARSVIAAHYSPDIIAFEHGPRLGCHKGGGCLEHAHLHLVPTAVDLFTFLKGKGLEPKFVSGFNKLREIVSRKQSSYLFVETWERAQYVVEVTIPLPSQYLRQIIATAEGKKEWDWRQYPDRETFERTLTRLRGKF